jgi:eukaryotic-like serine/threonine-protein kinase
LDVVSSDGTRRQLAKVPGVEAPRWRPDGRELCFLVQPPGRQTATLWEVAADGANPLQLALPGIEGTVMGCNWTPDGRYLYFTVHKSDSEAELWALREKGFSWRRTQRLTKLMEAPVSFHLPVADSTGRKLFATGAEFHGRLTRYDSRLGEPVDYLGRLPAYWVSFSRDGQWVAYISYLLHTVVAHAPRWQRARAAYFCST